MVGGAKLVMCRPYGRAGVRCAVKGRAAKGIAGRCEARRYGGALFRIVRPARADKAILCFA